MGGPEEGLTDEEDSRVRRRKGRGTVDSWLQGYLTQERRREEIDLTKGTTKVD